MREAQTEYKQKRFHYEGSLRNGDGFPKGLCPSSSLGIFKTQVDKGLSSLARLQSLQDESLQTAEYH